MNECRGLSNGDILYLELGTPLPSEHINIQFFMVTGNLQTQAGGHGKRDTTGSWLNVYKKSTTAQVLKKICKHLNISSITHRLRLIKGGDSGKLCSEVDRTITSYVQHGDTLLVEEGTIPRKGVATFNLHLFVTPEERIQLEQFELQNEPSSNASNASSASDKSHASSTANTSNASIHVTYQYIE